MSVSIALCTYNGQRFIREQIDSYLYQTIQPDEIVVCDDGSLDDTINIVKQYVATHPQIQWRVVQNEQTLGTNRNFEVAIGLCTGDLIFFSDQDDIWARDKIEIMRSFFEQNPECNGAFSNGSLIDESGREFQDTLLDHCFFKAGIRKKYLKDELLYQSILLGNIITGATMCIRRRMLSTIIPFHLELRRKLWWDGWIGFCLLATGQVGYIDKSLIKYRIHKGQQVGISSDNDSFEDYLLKGKYLESLVKEYFQRYLIAYSFMQQLKAVAGIPAGIENRITREYLTHRKKYFEAQSFFKKKLRLLKWHIQGINYISFKDLLTL